MRPDDQGDELRFPRVKARDSEEAVVLTSLPVETQIVATPMTFDRRLHGPSAFISDPSPDSTPAMSLSVGSFPVSQLRSGLGHRFVLMHMNRGQTISWASFQSAKMTNRRARESMSAVPDSPTARQRVGRVLRTSPTCCG